MQKVVLFQGGGRRPLLADPETGKILTGPISGVGRDELEHAAMLEADITSTGDARAIRALLQDGAWWMWWRWEFQASGSLGPPGGRMDAFSPGPEAERLGS